MTLKKKRELEDESIKFNDTTLKNEDYIHETNDIIREI